MILVGLSDAGCRILVGSLGSETQQLTDQLSQAQSTVTLPINYGIPLRKKQSIGFSLAAVPGMHARAERACCVSSAGLAHMIENKSYTCTSLFMTKEIRSYQHFFGLDVDE